MFAWEDPESKRIVQWDDLEAYDENIIHKI